jgi:hypothetical protein
MTRLENLHKHLEATTETLQDLKHYTFPERKKLIGEAWSLHNQIEIEQDYLLQMNRKKEIDEFMKKADAARDFKTKGM